MKLNLGCGDKLLEGFVNIDLHNPNVDTKWDLRNPLPYKDDSIDEIYAKHIIEHFTKLEWKRIKQDWYRVLKSKGILTIECPDIIRCMKRFIENKDGRRWSFWIMTIYGRQEKFGEGELHKNGFIVESLSADLKEEGFNILEYSYFYDETPDENGFNIKMKAIK